MNEWNPNMCGYSHKQTYGYDYYNPNPNDLSRYYGGHAPQAAKPPPAKAARSDFDQTAFPVGAFVEPRTHPHYPQAPPSFASSNHHQPASHPPLSLREDFAAYGPYDQTEDGARYCRRPNPYDVSQAPTRPLLSHFAEESRGDFGGSGPPRRSGDFRSQFPDGRKRPGSPPFGHHRRRPPLLESARPGLLQRPSLGSGCAPANRIVQPRWPLQGPLNAIRSCPTRAEPVSLLEATFAPPAGLPMLAKRERSVARWAKAVRKEWPAHERQMTAADAAGGRSLQFTSFLSDVLQRELRKNMTFVYGTLRDVALSDRGAKDEFYPRDARESNVLVDLCYDDVFVAQGCGAERFDARERASQNALQLFLRDRVFVVGCYRLWEGEPIPGFCASNTRHAPARLPPYPRSPKRERASSDKPDAKTLPWLQANPSSKMDTSARLKPKSMKDFFILINGRGDDYSESEEKSYDFQSGFPRSLNAVAVMNNSAQFNQMKVEYRASVASGGSHRCEIVLDQQKVGEGDGWDANQARRAACEAVLNQLSGIQPVVRMQLNKAEVVTRNQLDGWAEKLARERPEWLAEMDAKLDPANPMKEPHLQKVMDDAEAFLKQYIHDERQEPLRFGFEFTHDERMAIHKAARRLGLASKPYGPSWRLYQVVSLRFSLDALKRILLLTGIAGRYALVARGSGDFSHLLAEERPDEEEAAAANTG